MPTILVENLSKTYYVHKKQPGLVGALKGLVKREYENVKAVRNISFLIEEGELVGFIGPNGAGKTTTLKMLSGLLYPTRGTVRVLGSDPWQREYNFLRKISLVMGQKNQLWWDLPPQESFDLFKEIYAIDGDEYKKTLATLVDMLDLGDVLKTQVRKLSLGQRMKAELIAALLHRPKVLFLDEPTIGLDVVMQKTLREFIKEYNKEFKASIILTSHYMEDVRELAKRVIIINKGKILYDGLLQDIIVKYTRVKDIEIVFAETVPQERLKPFGKVKSYDENGAIVQVPREKIPETSANILKEIQVADINIKEVDIQDIIREIFGNQKV